MTTRTLPIALVWVALVGMLTGLLLVSQAQSRRELTDGFALRATIGARFAATYVQDLIARERRLATRHLGDTTVTARRFRAMTVDEGYEAAVLLDDRGRVLHVAPPDPTVLGKDITPRYAHLRAAVAGRARVSEVVPSAARGVPIVAFAVPYRSRAGRRVYSGAQEVAFTPLGAYLRNAIPIARNRIYVVDPDGTIIVESGSGPAATTLDAEDPQLARALRSHEEGSHSSSNGDRRFVSRPIAGTPWRLVSTVPQAELYGSISGPSRWGPWVVVVAFALLALIAAFLLARVLSSRVRLTLLNAELELTARVDVLTGLPKPPPHRRVAHGPHLRDPAARHTTVDPAHRHRPLQGGKRHPRSPRRRSGASHRGPLAPQLPPPRGPSRPVGWRGVPGGAAGHPRAVGPHRRRASTRGGGPSIDRHRRGPGGPDDRDDRRCRLV